ncbi:unnamed protein product [Rotaria sp. Silwood2]|nr:unnamed protein product [Rotaria sp. Silwood2]CAF4254988.1 unnamed protein product [Rotaria sp. Silwood2]
MTDSTLHLLDLPDEILLIIMSNISNFDVLYSLIGVNKKLDRVACDIVHTRSIDFIGTRSNDEIHSLSDKILDRFCQNILPRVHNNIECLTLESSSISRIFHSIDYPKLFKLILPELDLEFVSHYFNGKYCNFDVKPNSQIESFFLEQMPFIRIFNEQILHLVVTVMDKSENASLSDVTINLYIRIFNLFTSVTHLDFVIKNDFRHPPFSLDDLPSTACFSSNIVHLSIRVLGLEDCLCLLDGRLSQLHTFIVEIYYITPLMDGRLDDTVKIA